MRPPFFLFLATVSIFSCRFSGVARNEPRGHVDSPTQSLSTGLDSNEILFDSLPTSAKKRLPPGLREFQDVFANAAEQAIPAVVSIYSEKNISDPARGSPYDDFLNKGPFEYFFGEPDSNRSMQNPHRESGLGSGVLISPSGYILTNNHVIAGADLIKVRLANESEYIASVIGTDKLADIAVIKIKVNSGPLPTLPLGNSDILRIGEWVLAVGNPYGLSHTVTTGIISAKGRKNTGITSYENFIQTDAAINPGNSGGALLNLSGELIGINTAIFSRTGGYQGIGFAIPINMAKKITLDLIRYGEVTRGWLGISIQPINAGMANDLKLHNQLNGLAFHGALVNGVVPGSPAEASGLKRGDIITKLGSSEILDANDLLNRIALLIPEEWAEVWVIREGLTLSFKTRVAKRDEKRVTSYHGEDESEASLVGLQVANLTRELKERFKLDKTIGNGVVVIAVEAKSRAARAKIQAGDLLMEVNRIRVPTLNAYRTAMEQAIKGNKILLRIGREKKTFFITL